MNQHKHEFTTYVRGLAGVHSFPTLLVFHWGFQLRCFGGLPRQLRLGFVSVPKAVSLPLCVTKNSVPMMDHLWVQFQGPDPMGFPATS